MRFGGGGRDVTKCEERYSLLLDKARSDFVSRIDALANATVPSVQDGRGKELLRRSLEEGAWSISNVVRALPPGSLALRYLVLKDSIAILVISSDAPFFHEVQVREEDLDKMISDFRSDIENRSQNVTLSSNRLYGALLAPVERIIEASLARSPTSVLLIAPDKNIELVPFAALHDGGRYLVSKWTTSLFNDAVTGKLLTPPTGARLRAFGLSESRGGLEALRWVEREVRGVSKQIASEEPRLNERFTREQLFSAFRANRVGAAPAPIIHVATHLRGAGRPGASLIVGDGEIAVADLANLPMDNTELLALSACETAVGNVDSPGLRIEGLAQIAQKRGAHSVLASLWRVNDGSTADLMQRFYFARYGSGLKSTKAGALRQAQDDMRRGAPGREVVDPSQTAAWAHPYFWASFVIFGNPQ